MIRESKPHPSPAAWFSFFRIAVLVGLVFLAGAIAYLFLAPSPVPEDQEPPKEEQAAVEIHSGPFKRT